MAAVERLGRGYKLYVDGQYEAAKKELRGIDPKQMQNADYVLYLQAQSELLTGEPKAAREHFHELTLMPSRFSTVAKWRVADCDWDAGDLEAARKGYEAVLPSANENIVEAAVARFRIGEALAKKGATPAAQQQWRKVYVGEPMHPLAETALQRLVETKAPPITPDERIARAKTLTANRAWPRALEELALVPEDVPQATRDEADYWIGTTKFKMRRDYDVAAQKLLGVWQRLPGDERKVDALFHGARAWSRADKDDEAHEGLPRAVAEVPALARGGGGVVPHRLARLQPRQATRKRSPSSRRRSSATAARRSATTRAGTSASRAGWTGDVRGALGDFEQLAQDVGPAVGRQGRLLARARARQLEARRRGQGGVASARQRVSVHLLRAAGARAAQGARRRARALRPTGRAAPRSRSATLDVKLANDPLIMRVDELLLAGLTVEAGVELGPATRTSSSATAVSARCRCCSIATCAATTSRARTASPSRYSGGARCGSIRSSDADARAWWERGLPARLSRVHREVRTDGGQPAVLPLHDHAEGVGLQPARRLVRRRDRPAADDSADVAAGGERIDAPYTDDVLYDPEGNIRFGAWYIGHLLKKFKGQIPLGAGSYNAGPRAMMKWCQGRSGSRPLDEFIELSPYTQTREYMKKALDIYARYLWLYEKQDYLPDNKVDADYVENDIDY